jgi:hypothetical protein
MNGVRYTVCVPDMSYCLHYLECIMQSGGHHFYSTALGYNTESGGVDERPITNAI